MIYVGQEELLTKILSQYGEPPRIGENWDTAYYKILDCILAMQREILDLKQKINPENYSRGKDPTESIIS